MKTLTLANIVIILSISQTFASSIRPAGLMENALSRRQEHQHPTHSDESELATEKLRHPQNSAMAKLLSVQDLPPRLNKGAIRKVYRYGPYHVPGAKEPSVGVVTDKIRDSMGSLMFNQRLSSFCGGECVVLKGSGIVEYKNGTATTALGSSIYNHHIFGVNMDDVQPKHVCPGSSSPTPRVATTFMGGGTDSEFYSYAFNNLTMKAGYEVKKGDRIDIQSELMNYRDEPQTIIMALDVEYLPGKQEGFLSTKTIEFVAANCDSGYFFDPTAKKFSSQSSEWTVPVDGYIVNIRGHEHDGGSGVHVSVNNKLVCSSIPTYEKVDEALRVKEFSQCENFVQLRKGDKITLKADYDVEKYPRRKSNQGDEEKLAALVMITFGFPSGFRL